MEKNKNMTKLEKQIRSLQFIFRPRFWMMNDPFNQEWDDKLNQLMDKFEPEYGKPNSIDGHVHTVSFDGNVVWIQNYPYAYGTPYGFWGTSPEIRPSRLTILRLRDLVTETQRKLEHESSSYKSYMDKVNNSLNQ